MRERRKSLCYLCLPCSALMLLALSAVGDTPALPRAHAHNDYLHERPLLDALDRGFCSVEADIHLVDGALLVAHDLKGVKPERTLQRLYLDPLKERAKKSGGRIFTHAPEFTLLIDIKSDAEATYAKLREVLADYTPMLTEFTNDTTETRAVTVLISGNCPRDLILSATPRWAAIDGRIPDLESTLNAHQVPLISASWTSVFDWRGAEPISVEEGVKLRDIVARAHARGQRVRFWGLPVRPLVWPELYDAGVDLLNADQLDKLRDFLRERSTQ